MVYFLTNTGCSREYKYIDHIIVINIFIITYSTLLFFTVITEQSYLYHPASYQSYTIYK